MAKSYKPNSVAFKLFGGLFGTKAGFGILAASVILTIVAISPGFFGKLLTQLLNEVGQPLITLAIIGLILAFAFKKIRGH